MYIDVSINRIYMKRDIKKNRREYVKGMVDKILLDE